MAGLVKQDFAFLRTMFGITGTSSSARYGSDTATSKPLDVMMLSSSMCFLPAAAAFWLVGSGRLAATEFIPGKPPPADVIGAVSWGPAGWALTGQDWLGAALFAAVTVTSALADSVLHNNKIVDNLDLLLASVCYTYAVVTGLWSFWRATLLCDGVLAAFGSGASDTCLLVPTAEPIYIAQTVFGFATWLAPLLLIARSRMEQIGTIEWRIRHSLWHLAAGLCTVSCAAVPMWLSPHESWTKGVPGRWSDGAHFAVVAACVAGTLAAHLAADPLIARAKRQRAEGTAAAEGVATAGQGRGRRGRRPAPSHDEAETMPHERKKAPSHEWKKQ